MPYRRLPNTDQARLRAMKAAYAMGRETHPTELAFTQSSYTKLELFINSYEQAILQYRTAYQRQATSSAVYQPVVQKARLYVSHFIQVVNMAVLRGELKPDIRKYYQLPVEEGRLPSLTAEPELIEWGQRIIDGEFQRTSEGKPPIMNPNIALVKVHYEKFVDIYKKHRTGTHRARNTARDGRPAHPHDLERSRGTLRRPRAYRATCPCSTLWRSLHLPPQRVTQGAGIGRNGRPSTRKRGDTPRSGRDGNALGDSPVILPSENTALSPLRPLLPFRSLRPLHVPYAPLHHPTYPMQRPPP